MVLMRKPAAVLTMAVLALLLPTNSGASAAACEQISVESWDVKVQAKDEVVRVGEKARITMKVTRKQTGAAVPNATAAVMILDKGDHATFGFEETNDAGRATFRVPLHRKASAGPVTLFGYAYTRHVDTICASMSEYGFERVPNAFRIRS
jgi:hypothetical protein